MSEVKGARPRTENEAVVERARDFWSRSGKMITIVLGVLIVGAGGYLAYKNFIQAPKEKKAADAIFKVQNSYDSLYSASGDLQAKFVDQTIADAENVIKQYGGTKAGNLARFYAGSAYLKKGSFDKAVSHLKEFDSDDAPQIQARAYKLLGDAYAEQGKGKDALDYYKKAAHHFEDDDAAASEALYMAAYLADKVLKDKNSAIDLYKEVKTKYGQTQWGFEAEKFLATHGVYDAE